MSGGGIISVLIATVVIAAMMIFYFTNDTEPEQQMKGEEALDTAEDVIDSMEQERLEQFRKLE